MHSKAILISLQKKYFLKNVAVSTANAMFYNIIGCPISKPCCLCGAFSIVPKFPLGNLQIFGTKHKKMQIYLKWLKYRLKIIISSFTYYFHTVIIVSKLKK